MILTFYLIQFEKVFRTVTFEFWIFLFLIWLLSLPHFYTYLNYRLFVIYLVSSAHLQCFLVLVILLVLFIYLQYYRINNCCFIARLFILITLIRLFFSIIELFIITFYYLLFLHCSWDTFVVCMYNSNWNHFVSFFLLLTLCFYSLPYIERKKYYNSFFS